MSNKLEEMRKKLQQMEQNAEIRSTGSDAIFPHWNDQLIPVGEQARVRFLPDGNEENSFFWVERQVIKLEFPGVKGQDASKNVRVDVPCMEMWGETCPILAEVRPWFKSGDKTDEELGRKYWKKRSWLLQGFVVDCPGTEENAPENPIRRFIMSRQLFEMIKSGIMDPDFEDLPTDYENGTDFIIAVSKKGQYKDYTTSKWARKSRALTDEERSAIDEYGIQDLSSYLPKKPSSKELDGIFQLFQDSLDGNLYDPEEYAWLPYRPAGISGSTKISEDVSEDENKETKVTKNEEKELVTETEASDNDSDDQVKNILNKIRSKKG